MLSHYDLEQQFPAYGFGAKLKSNGETKWCFPLTGKSSKHCVHGITVTVRKLIESRRNGSFFSIVLRVNSGDLSSYMLKEFLFLRETP